MNHLGSGPYFEIPLLPLSEAHNLLDSTDAIPKIENALQVINMLPNGELIRVVNLGTGYSHFLYEAITYLLKEWKDSDGAPRTAKYMQFITSGDTAENSLANFCQWLCVSGLCENIEFYNTRKYHPFGYCSAEYKDS